MNKNISTTVAATMEPAVSRRRVLLGLGAATATAAALASPKPANGSPTVPSASVGEAPAIERAQHLADALAAVMAEINPNRSWKSDICPEAGFAVIAGHIIKLPAIYDEAGFYEVALVNGTHPVLWLERFDHESGTGHYYTGAHRWGNRFETAPRRFREKQIRIVRKIEDRRA